MDFTHLIALMMRFYGVTLNEIKNMKLSAFWALVSQVPALRLQEGVMFANNASCAIWGDEKDTKEADDVFDKRSMAQFRNSIQ